MVLKKEKSVDFSKIHDPNERDKKTQELLE